jgi:glyoxylase-like metal-dependent hydrolase (beta-lactamase superfamily II)
MIERKVVVGPFQCNCRILVCPKTARAAIIDPGDETSQILSTLKKLESELGKPIQVDALFHTHGHLDHVGAARGVKTAIPGSSIYLHKGDEPLYQALIQQGQLFGMKYDEPLPVDQYFEHEQELKVGELRFSLVHTPGHSPGSVCLRLHEDSTTQTAETLYSGDTLFHGSVGRTDLWGADQNQMFKNIRERILTLDGDTRVCPGHGPDTAVGVEKTSNPFLV